MKKKKIPFKQLPKSIQIRQIFSYFLLLLALLSLGYFIFYIKQANNTQDNYEKLSEIKDRNVVTPVVKNTTVVMHLSEEEEAPDIIEEYMTLYNSNKSMVGWITIDDTLIDYPVMQSPNNDYYLNHNFKQESDNNGSIFIDSDCCIWPRSQNIIIYGHNMKSGKMFGQLKKYKSESFYKEHPGIKFDTLYERGMYQIIFVFSDIVYDEAEVAFKYYQFIDANSPEEWDSAMNYMKNKSLYDTGLTAEYGDKLITLSTCDYEKDAERFVIVAKKL